MKLLGKEKKESKKKWLRFFNPYRELGRRKNTHKYRDAQMFIYMLSIGEFYPTLAFFGWTCCPSMFKQFHCRIFYFIQIVELITISKSLD